MAGDGQARDATPGLIHDARTERFGRSYAELVPGETYRHWPGKTVTEADDHLFCLLTMAASPLHIDAHFAATEMDGGRNLVVGTYVYSLALGMSVPDISGRATANLGVERLRHVSPLFHGDTLYAFTRILDRRRSRTRPDAGIVTVETWGTNQSGDRVIEFERAFMLPHESPAD
jgi:acyl dehydratase